MEFRLTTDIEKTLAPQQIGFNFDELKKWLTTDLAPYRTLVVTEDTIPEAKKAKAEVNKLRDAIDGQRKSVKKAWMSPYMAFEEKCKELTALCNEASDNIGGQLNEYDEKRKRDKREVCFQIYKDHIGDMGDYVKFDYLYSDKWLNVTVRLDAIETEIMAAIAKANMEVKAIRALGSPYVTELLDYYADTHDLAATLAKDNSLKTRARVEAEIKKQSQPIEPQPPVAPNVSEEPENRELFEISFRVVGTQAQIAALRLFLLTNKYDYERITK